MVGVPGKFLGCETCRVRRVKCDNERPICKKCINSGRNCQGYVRPRTFIVGTPDKEGRVSLQDRRLFGISAETQLALHKRNIRPEKTKPLTNPLIRVSDASLNDIQVLALNANILTLERVYESSNSSFTLPPLLNCLPDLTKRSPALEYALRALCLIHLGVIKKEYRLIAESAHTNLQALAKVRGAILSPNTATKIETLAASICLYLYEQIACSAEKGDAWRILFRGSSLLVRQRGPASYKAFPDHHFFVRLFRNDACFDALSRSVSTFLSEREWLTMPWEDIPKSAMDCLFDIQFLLPPIFEREGQLQKVTPSIARRSEAKELLNRCIKIVKMFDDWYDDLDAQTKGGPLFWSIPRQTHKEGSIEKLGFDMCSIFPDYFQFVDLNTAFLHLYYWAALSLFFRKIQHIHNLLIEEIPEQSQDPAEPHTTRSSPESAASPLLTPPMESLPRLDQSFFRPISSQPLTTTFLANPAPESSSPDHAPRLNPKYSEDAVLELACLICKSLPYTLNRTFHSLGPDHSAWPIWCALQVFKRQACVGELAWCEKMLEVWSREGWKFGFQMGTVEWG